jgi:hypothetical protein
LELFAVSLITLFPLESIPLVYIEYIKFLPLLTYKFLLYTPLFVAIGHSRGLSNLLGILSLPV